MKTAFRHAPLLAVALMVGCGQSPEATPRTAEDGHDHAETAAAAGDTPAAADTHDHDDANSHDDAGHADGDEDAHGHGEAAAHGHGEEDDHDQIHLSDAQIQAARIEVASVGAAAGGAVRAPAVVAADPTRSAIVATAVGGRVRSLQKNVGEAVKAGETLAVLDSREAAEFGAELDAARQQLQLARSTLEREERLFGERVSPEVDVLTARTAAREAEIRVRLAQDRIGAAGAVASGSSALSIRTPIAGYVVSRTVDLGAAVAADTELFRIADLSRVALEFALLPDSAPHVEVGSAMTVTAGARSATGKIAYLSPVIDPQTRQVRATAFVDNDGQQWRIGETVEVDIPLARGGDAVLTVPKTALQTVEGKPSVFVRNDVGFKVTHIRTGDAAGDAVVVTGGLSAQDRIAISNTFVLKAEAGKGEGGHDH